MRTFTTSALNRISTRASQSIVAHRYKSPFLFPSSFSEFATSRGMASSPEKFEWLVVIPDKEGTLEKRLAVRPQHLSTLGPRVESGFWKMGGAFFNSVPVPDTTPPFAGSCMVAYASKEEVLSVINGDIYAKEGVWDLEKMTIFPFKTAFRTELK